MIQGLKSVKFVFANGGVVNLAVEPDTRIADSGPGIGREEENPRRGEWWMRTVEQPGDRELTAKCQNINDLLFFLVDVAGAD